MADSRPSHEDRPNSAPGLGDVHQRFQTVHSKFMFLCKDLHLPFLDMKLYEKYITKEETEDNLVRLCLLVKTLVEHRKRTMHVLQLSQRRDVVVLCLLAVANDFVRGRMTTLVLQSKALRLLFLLQKLTLRIVEAVEYWRTMLTRPFPFIFRGRDVLLQILADNRQISNSVIGQMLPLKMADFPLLSHLPSLGLFKEDQAAQSTTLPGDPRQPHPPKTAVYPLRSSASAQTYRVVHSAKQQKRLRNAERYLKEELQQQQVLVKELLNLCDKGFFVPILQTPLVPRCGEGVELRSSLWAEKLQRSLLHTVSYLQQEAIQIYSPKVVSASPPVMTPQGVSTSAMGENETGGVDDDTIANLEAQEESEEGDDENEDDDENYGVQKTHKAQRPMSSGSGRGSRRELSSGASASRTQSQTSPIGSDDIVLHEL